MDTPGKCNGSAVFGIDVVVPGMLNAAIKSARSFSGQVTAINNEADILKMSGVRAVVKLAALAIANEDAGSQHPRLPDLPRRNAVCVVADQFWQANQNGLATDNFGGSKGLELIPFQNTEVILGIPPWIAHNGSIRLPTKKKSVNTDGWGDQTFLLKYRLLSANEENGNYIVTAFMGFSAPTGDDGNSAGHGLFTPILFTPSRVTIGTFDS